MTESLSSKHPRAFIEGLTRPQKKILDELRELMAHQESNLAWYHRTGSKVLELQEAVEKRGPGWPRDLAGALGISPSSLVKMRKFATDFAPRQAERLDQLGANWGMVLAVQHARTTDRMKLLEEAIAKSLTVTDLHTAVKQRFGARNPGGRPLRKPRSMKEGLVQLQALGEKWLKFYHEIWAGGDEPLKDQGRDLSTKERQRLAVVLPAVRRTMKQIQHSSQAVDNLLGELERKARRF